MLYTRRVLWLLIVAFTLFILLADVLLFGDASAAVQEGDVCGSLHARKEQPYKMAVCTMIHNEVEYIEEWLEYHLLMKVEHFFIYNDGSTDNIQEVLSPYIEQGIVSLFYWDQNQTVNQLLVPKDPPFTRDQRFALADCIFHHQQETEWIGIWDIDEFVVVHEPFEDLIQVISTFVEVHRWDNLQIPLTFFGPSNHDSKPKGLVMENYLFRLNKTQFGQNEMIGKFSGKSLYRSGCGLPEVHFAVILPAKCRPHTQWIDLDNDYFPVHFNHYFTKSWEDFEAKMSKWHWTANYQQFIDESKVYGTHDSGMLKYVDAVKQGIMCQRKNCKQ